MNLSPTPLSILNPPFITYQAQHESSPNVQNMTNSMASRKSNPRALYFRKQYKLLLHKIHIFNSVSCLAVTSDVARDSKQQCQSVFVLDKIVDVAAVNAIKGTQDFIDEKVTIYFKQQNLTNNSIIGSVKFDMAHQKMLKIQNPKSFQKQFENNNGFIEYKFISYQSHHIKTDEVTAQKNAKQNVLNRLNDTKEAQFEALIKAKDQIIKQLESKVTELIDEGRKFRKSVSKQKQTLTKQIQKLKVENVQIKKTPPKRDSSPKSNLLQLFSPKNKFSLLPQQQQQQNQQKVFHERQSGFKINVKVLSTKVHQKQVQQLQDLLQQNRVLKKIVEELRKQTEELNVENKLQQERINQLNKNLKITQNRHQMETIAMKESVKLTIEKNKLMNLSNYYTQLQPPSDNFLSMNPKQSTDQKLSPNQLSMSGASRQQNPKPKFSTNEYITDKKIDPQTVTILHKLEEENEMLGSRLQLKEDECARVLKELESCTVQLRKKNSEIQQWKLKCEELKARYSGYIMDQSDSKQASMIGNKESLMISGIHAHKLSIIEKEVLAGKPATIQKVFMQMKESLINYEGKIQDKEIQLMKSRIAEETLQKQKALYQNKYMSILQTLESIKQKYAQSLSKQAQLEQLKTQNEQLRAFMDEMMKRYEEEFKMRTDFQEKADRYKTKVKEMAEEWQRLKLMETEYDSVKRKNINTEKTFNKFETNFNQMKKVLNKVQDSYLNITKKRKSTSKEQVNKEELQQLLQESINRLNQVEEEYFKGMRDFYEFQKKQIDSVAEKRFKLECDKIDQRKELRQQERLLKKEAIEETLESDRKAKRRKIDAKIKALLNQKDKVQEQNQKLQGLTILDRVKAIEKRLRQLDQKTIEAPNNKIRVNGSEQEPQPQSTSIRVSSPVVEKLSNETRQKIQRLEQQNERLRSMASLAKDSITSGDRKSLGTGKGSDHPNLLKTSENANLQMQKSGFYAGNTNTDSMIKDHRKTIMEEMNKGRQIFNKTFNDLRKQNTELLKKKTDYEIELQNMRFKEEKLVMKSQDREREMQRMFKHSNDELMKAKERLETKIEKIETQNTILFKQKKDLQESLSAVILELRKVTDALIDKNQEFIDLQNDATLMRERIFNYEEAERQMITEIQHMRETVVGCEERFQRLFEERDAEFVKIQNLKEAEIAKLKKFIRQLEESVDEELGEQLRLKEEIEKYERAVKDLQEKNFTLEQSEKNLSEKFQNLRNHTMEDMLRLEEENESLRSELIKIAQETTVLEQELEKSRYTIESLERQVQALEPIYNEMCQLQLKHETEKEKYQQLMGGQNQKFIDLKQMYEKIVETVKQVETDNRELRQRDIQFENMRANVNDKLFDRERLVLKVEKEKHALEVEFKRIRQELDDTKEKQDHYVLENQELAIKNDKLQQLNNELKEKQKTKPKSRVHIHDGNSLIDEPINQSKVFGLNSRMNIAQSTNRQDSIRKSKLSLSRSNSRVLNRSNTKIEHSKQLNAPSNKQIGLSKSILKSKSLVQHQQSPELRRSSNVLIGQGRSSRELTEISQPVSPIIRVLKEDLHQIEENIDEMKATIFVTKGANIGIHLNEKIPQSNNDEELKTSMIMALDDLVGQAKQKTKQKLTKAKTLEEDLNIQEVEDSSYLDGQNEDEEQDNYNFEPEEESEFQALIGLDKKDIIERVHELKEELASLSDENQGLKMQLQNYMRLISQNQLNSSPQQMQQMYPQISIYHQRSGDPSKERNKFFGDKDDFNVFRDGMQYRGQNISMASLQSMSEKEMMLQSEWKMMSRNNEGMMSRAQQTMKNGNQRFSRNNTAQNQQHQEQIKKLKEEMAQKQLTIEQHLQQINQLTDQLQHEKQNTNRLLEEVESLMRDTESVENSLREKSEAIERLGGLLVEQRRKFEGRLERVLGESLEKDRVVSEMARRCDKLEKVKEEALKEKLKLEEKYDKYTKEYQKHKHRQKSTEHSYKQYQQQSQLQILKLNEQNDYLLKQLKAKSKQLQQLAQRYIQLENKLLQTQQLMVEQGNKVLGRDEKMTALMGKYKEVVARLEESEQKRRETMKERERLESELLYNQEVIRDVNKKASMKIKKHTIQQQASAQALAQLQAKNQHLHQQSQSLKQQLSLLNQQLLSMRHLHKDQARDYQRVQKQLKDIMASYQAEFSQVNSGKVGLAEEVKRVNGLIREKEKELEEVRREKHSLEGELYRVKNQLFEMKKQFQFSTKKAAQQIKQLHQKYAFKNNDYQILKHKLNHLQSHQIDTSSSTMGRNRKVITSDDLPESNLHVKRPQNQVQKLSRQLKEKDKQLQSEQKQHKLKQIESKKQLESLTNHQLLFTTRIHQLQQQLAQTKHQLTTIQRTLSLNQHTHHLNQQSAINSLNSELQHYELRVEQLERENFYLKKHNEQVVRNSEDVKRAYVQKECVMREQVGELEREVEFYQAKRIDELNLLMNETYDG